VELVKVVRLRVRTGIGGEEIESSPSPVAEPAGQIVETQEIGDAVLTVARTVGHGSGSASAIQRHAAEPGTTFAAR
jgi:hypothetical protein